MDFDKGQRSMVAWYFMFSICFLSASRSIFAKILNFLGEKKESRDENCYVIRYQNTTEKAPDKRESEKLIFIIPLLFASHLPRIHNVNVSEKERKIMMKTQNTAKSTF